MSKPLVVIAIGGNSLISDSNHRTVADQYHAAGETSSHIAHIVKHGYRVVVSHGNGPQVGFILLRSELAKDFLHRVPLEVCVADTQGAIGYQVAQTLRNELHRLQVDQAVVAIVTQVIVDPEDDAFQNPSKPIGPFMTKDEAEKHVSDVGWMVREDAGRGWRRVVASPVPLEIVELPTIRTLLAQDTLVIAGGGGGIPVVRLADGSLQGIPAVIDKDKATSLMATELGASFFVLSTGVEKIALHFGQPHETWLDSMTLREAKAYLDEGHFAPGSMLPKMEAAITFLENGGEKVIVTSPESLERALRGETGTRITP